MNINSKAIKLVRFGLFNGIIFALVMAGFDYLRNTPFSWEKFVFFSMGYGVLMVIINRKKLLKVYKAKK
ncbi:hypothetical protein [Mangrovimonas aestuarii]|uniref:hypothetical protein n=1 Tax=Mangrovimonas aestuarii TaxID=3018443 RepID=UPI0023785576|nr:hypothetical protein [Mangrovimonas aestuarii]